MKLLFFIFTGYTIDSTGQLEDKVEELEGEMQKKGIIKIIVYICFSPYEIANIYVFKCVGILHV